MSVYVGIDVHRKRSQVAVVTEDGQVQLNKNVVNGSEPILRLIGDLPSGTPVAIRGRVRLGLAGRSAGGLRLRGAPGAPAAVQGHRLGAAEERQGPARRSWRSCCARTCCPRRGSPRRRCGSSARCCGTGSAWSGSALSSATGSTRSPPTTATTGRAATGPGQAAAGWPSWTCRPRRGRSSPTAWPSPAGLAPLTGRIDGELHQHAKTGPRVKVLRTLPGVGEFTALMMLAEIGDISRFGSARKLASWAGPTPTVRGPGPDRPARAHLQARLGLAALGAQPGREDRQAVPAVRRHPLEHRPAPREEDRHHRDLPQAADPRLPPAGRHASHRPGHAATAAVKTGGSPSPGHARSCGMSRRQRRARSSD